MECRNNLIYDRIETNIQEIRTANLFMFCSCFAQQRTPTDCACLKVRYVRRREDDKVRRIGYWWECIVRR